MRVRKIPGAIDKIQQHPQVITQPQKYWGCWKQHFENKPIHLEIGMGRGQFLIEMARQNPHIHYIGIEKYDSILIGALDKLEGCTIPNLSLLNVNGEHILEIFHKSEIQQIYLNFSDPWPKQRHQKRRLTHRNFLEKYAFVLEAEGNVHVKTDNEAFFLFSLEEFEHCDWTLKNINYDLHNSSFASTNVMTEYEQRFLNQGKPIYRLEAKRPSF
ncbi:MAG: tRNA (guanosine(46)-N7)-methyltransferase TrmB [Epulopiscium sp.]|nr:tRNA (guanosine(46)-N7)-methyltransferase TrmB [Candidatus Epulonipiscium sp.]